MEVRIYGNELSPNVTLVCRSIVVINDVINQLNALIRTYGQATIFDLYDVCGLDVPKHVSERCAFLGWVNVQLYHSYGYTGNGRYTCSLPKAVVILTGHSNVQGAASDGKVQLKFKEALPKSAKDAKIQKAYNVLTKAYCRYDTNEDDLVDAMGEAIRTLGEVLE